MSMWSSGPLGLKYKIFKLAGHDFQLELIPHWRQEKFEVDNALAVALKKNLNFKNFYFTGLHCPLHGYLN